MADFCWDCVRDDLGVDPERNDLHGGCPPGETFSALCEGCGFGWFTHEGRRVRWEEGFSFHPEDCDDSPTMGFQSPRGH